VTNQHVADRQSESLRQFIRTIKLRIERVAPRPDG
jgi:hypothetical protein